MKTIKFQITDEEATLLKELEEILALREKTGMYKRVFFDLNISPIILLRSAMIIKELNVNKNQEYIKFVNVLEGLVPYNEKNRKNESTTKKNE